MLGVVVKGEVPITDPVQVIEPIEDEDGGKPAKKPGGKPQPGASGRKQQDAKPAEGSTTSSKAQATPTVMVQMSHEWIRENIKKAVHESIADEILLRRQQIYTRHLFYAPIHHPSGSPETHFRAKQDGKPDER